MEALAAEGMWVDKRIDPGKGVTTWTPGRGEKPPDVLPSRQKITEKDAKNWVPGFQTRINKLIKVVLAKIPKEALALKDGPIFDITDQELLDHLNEHKLVEPDHYKAKKLNLEETILAAIANGPLRDFLFLGPTQASALKIVRKQIGVVIQEIQSEH